MKDELISRQAAIDEIEYELEMINLALDSITLDYNARERLRQRRGEAREILNSIQQLPSAQPEQQWIPCSDRLPEEKGEYLVAYHPCYWDDVEAEVKVGVDSFRGKTSWAKQKYQRVIAWMPLPPIYQGITSK